jgi:hypothetical protein
MKTYALLASDKVSANECAMNLAVDARVLLRSLAIILDMQLQSIGEISR